MTGKVDEKKYRDILKRAKREVAAVGKDYKSFITDSRRPDVRDSADLILPLQAGADADAADVLVSSVEGAEFSVADMLPSLRAQLFAQYLCAKSVTVERLVNVKRRLLYFNESDALYCISLLILLERGEELRAFCRYLDFVDEHRLLGQEGGDSADFMRFAYYLRACVGAGCIQQLPSFEKAYQMVPGLVSGGREGALIDALDERLSLVRGLIKSWEVTPLAFALAPVEILALVKLANSSETDADHIHVPSHVSIPALFASEKSGVRKWPPEVGRFIESIKGELDSFVDDLPTRKSLT